MWRDLLKICGGILSTGIIAWALWGNSENVPRMQALRAMAANPELKLVSERSPYMRNER
jgi:hypothetical protein